VCTQDGHKCGDVLLGVICLGFSPPYASLGALGHARSYRRHAHFEREPDWHCFESPRSVVLGHQFRLVVQLGSTQTARISIWSAGTLHCRAADGTAVDCEALQAVCLANVRTRPFGGLFLMPEQFPFSSKSAEP